MAVKPRTSPVFHAIQSLIGNQTQDSVQAFRGLGRGQNHPGRTKGVDDVDLFTGLVGLGVAITSFAALWIFHHNRQSLDVILRDGLFERAEKI